MRRVILESPYAGNIWQRWRNRRYARQCLAHSLVRGEAPIASHLLYTQVLDDRIPLQRQMGIDAGLAWRVVTEATVVYIDRGISLGMAHSINKAIAAGTPVEYRRLHALDHNKR